jgi:ATP-dependent helicase/nuclease subunit A
MDPELLAADGRARQTLLTDFTNTFFVDAGAGTGKTTAIVGRIGELVAHGRMTMAQLVAITFTEAAAAELRIRIRERLQVLAIDGTRPVEQRERCRLATTEIGKAAVDTIHAFSGDLLRTYPLEAELPPDFTTMDEIEAAIDFEERFRSWLEHVADDPVHRDAVRQCLLLGLGPDHVFKVAAALHENYDLLAGASWTLPMATDPVAVAQGAAADLREIQRLCREHAPGGHEAIPLIEGLSFSCDRLGDAATSDDALVALAAVEEIYVPGNASRWPRIDGQTVFARIKELRDGVEDDAKEALQAHRTRLFCRLLDALRAFVLGYATDRKRLGVATFQDLLVWARDLLQASEDVRQRVRSRWAQVFVDEFQDTDPLQAEIAFYLCSDPAQAVPNNWRDIQLEQGKLCLVGDPKQSIYRFRRADIALYQAIRKLVAEPLVLSRNFRSVPAVLEFVNRHFAGVMTLVEGAQAGYQPLVANVVGSGPSLWTFGEPIDGKQPEVWVNEADYVAGVVARIVGEEWKVRDRDTHQLRAAKHEDICVLIPSRTNLRRLERAFEAADIPYRIESGEILLNTQEVRDLLSALRGIDDPSDQVAVVAALRSPIYGCSDPELLRWTATGGHLNYLYPGDSDVDRVRGSLEHLKSFHESRTRVSVAALVERYIDDRMLVAAAFGERRPRESWRRYRYVASRARVFASTGRTTLREFVEWMESLGRNQARDVSGSIAESDEDAVRVLTVHRAKGLEFPIVIMTGLGSSRPFFSPTVIGDRLNEQVHAAVTDTRGHQWASPGFKEACDVERQLDKAEGVRLAYVAATRARDHLVIGLHRKVDESREVPAVAFAETLVSMGDLVRAVVPLRTIVPATPAPAAGRSATEVRAAEEAWIAQRRTAIAAAEGTPYVSATARAKLAENEETVPEPDVARFRRGRGGTSVGRAVHAVLQSIDLATIDGLETLAQAHAAAEGIPKRADDVAQLVRRACESEPVRRAVESGRLWREVPIGAPRDEMVLEGFIDLLFEGPDGYEIVDYKTDDIRDSELADRMAHYQIQGDSYAELVRSVTHIAPVAVSFVFVAANKVVRLKPSLPTEAPNNP